MNGTPVKAVVILAVTLGLAPYLGAAQNQPTQQALAPSGQVSVDQNLSNRATEYYQHLLKGENAAAFAMVAPESKDQFFKLHNEGLTDARILSIKLAEGSDSSAVIKVQKSVKPLQFNEAFDLQSVDTWKKVDGQWYIVIPDPKETDSPFGRVLDAHNVSGAGPASASSNSPPDLNEIKRRAETNTKNADADQYLLALKKAMAAQTQAASQPVKDPKSDGKDKKKTDPKQDSKINQNN